MLSFFECLVCMFVLFIYNIFLSVFFVFHGNNHVLLNLINRYATSTSEYFLKSKYIVEKCEVNFWYQQLFIQWNIDNCCEYIAEGVNIYLYGWFSHLVPVCALCLSLWVWYQIRVLAKILSMCPISVNLMPCCTKNTTRFLWY